jgi:hypothetical protein
VPVIGAPAAAWSAGVMAGPTAVIDGAESLTPL